MVLTTKEASYIIVLGIVISVLPISSTYDTEVMLSVPYSIAQLSADGHCENSICMLDIYPTMIQH
jgi:hypothetical protein